MTQFIKQHDSSLPMPSPGRWLDSLRFAAAFALSGYFLGIGAVSAASLDTSVGPLQIEAAATGLEEPWAIGFLPDGGVLITERAGRLLLLKDGNMSEVAGVPHVAVNGQGGLLDVLVPRDFSDSRELFFSFAKSQSEGEGTALMKVRLSEDGTTLENPTTVFEITEGTSGGRHFGSRVVEAPDARVTSVFSRLTPHP